VERLEERQHWDLVFVKANSQIYRNSHDMNVDFFNQRFIDAEIYSPLGRAATLTVGGQPRCQGERDLTGRSGDEDLLPAKALHLALLLLAAGPTRARNAATCRPTAFDGAQQI
jgi:hypothetical protein